MDGDFLERFPRFKAVLSRYSPATRESYVSRVRRFLRLVGVKDSYDVADIDSFISILQSEVAENEAGDAYIRNMLIAVRCFLRTTKSRPEVGTYVSDRIRDYARKTTQYIDGIYLSRQKIGLYVYSEQDVVKLLRAAMQLDSRDVEYIQFGEKVVLKDYERNGWVRTLLVGLSYILGCRPVELLNIRIGDIKMREYDAVFFIRTAKRGRPVKRIVNDPLVVDILRKRLNWLMDRLGRRLSDDTRLFDFGHRNAYRLMRQVAELAGVPTFRKRTFYGFRRKLISDLIAKNANPVQIANIMGWRKLEMVPYYNKQSLDELALEFAEKYPRRLPSL